MSALLTFSNMNRSALATGETSAFRTYAGERDLSSLEGACLVQDSAGYVLVCTEFGVFAYDGRRFVNLGPKQGLRLGGQVLGIGLTRAGRIVVRYSNDVLLSDRATDSTHPPTSLAFKAVPHPGLDLFDQRTHLLTVWRGDVVMLAGGTVVRLTEQTGGAPAMASMGYDQGEQRLLSDARAIFTADGHLWESFSDTKLCRADPGAVMCYGEKDGLRQGPWLDVVPDGPGRILARSSVAVATLDTNRSSVWSVEDLPDQANRLGDLPHGVGLFRAPEGSLMTQADHGLVIRGPKGWHLVTVQDGAPAGTITSSLTDSSGQLWFQVAGRGLVRWVGFGVWEAVQKSSGLSDGFPWRSLSAPDGTVWVATDTGVDGIRRAGQGGRRVVQTLPGAAFALALGPDDELWRGYFNQGVRIENFTRGTSRLLAVPPVNVIGRGIGRVMWLGTEGGLFRVDTPTGGPTGAPVLLSSPKSVVHDLISDGVGGVFYVCAGHLRHLHADGTDATIGGAWPDSSFVPFTLALDHDGRLWVGGDGGLYRFTVVNDQPAGRVTIPPEDTRANSVVALLVDRRGWIWAGTPLGISVFNGKVWVSADSEGGLATDDVDEGGLSEDRDGSIWVATTQGMSHLLDPESLFVEKPIRVVISGATLGTNRLTGGVLPYAREPLTLQFGTPNADTERAFSFRYILSGVDDGWAESATGLVRYSSLPPGRHVLTVVGYDQLTRRSSAPASLVIEMAYPWWRQWWAMILATLSAGGVVWGLVHLRFRALLSREAELRRRVDEATRALQYQATHDSLTGLLNRSEIESRLAARLTATEANEANEANEEMIIALVDIDHFKRVNDNYGHLGGDDVLRAVGRLIAKALRPGEYAGRYGGEEALIVLSDADGRGAERVLELHHIMRGMPFAAAGYEIRLTCSIGVAWARRGDNWESLIGRADDALYRAKNAGRNRVVESGRLNPTAETVVHERRQRPSTL